MLTQEVAARRRNPRGLTRSDRSLPWTAVTGASLRFASLVVAAAVLLTTLCPTVSEARPHGASTSTVKRPKKKLLRKNLVSKKFVASSDVFERALLP